MSLTIGIDAGPLLGRGGISMYVDSLVRTWLRIDPASDYRLVVRRSWLAHEALASLETLAPVVSVHTPDRVLKVWWDRLGLVLPEHLRFWRTLDVFLATCLVTPVLPHGSVISIVYDLIPLRLPELFPNHRAIRRTIEDVVRRSAAVIAISQRTKQDLIELLGVDPARVHLIYPGYGEAFRPCEASAFRKTARRYGIEGPYVLYVGALGPHKNVSTLLSAFEQARRKHDMSAQLVLTGRAEWGAKALALLKSLSVKADVVLTGEVPVEDLPSLYAGADVFVFPSRYEGFGMPVLEAMACGTPVIVSNRGALPEVAGEAGLYVEPDDVEGLAATIARVVGEPHMREKLAVAVLQQAHRFSWQRSAEDLAVLVRKVAGSSPISPRCATGRRTAVEPSKQDLSGPSVDFYDEAYFEGKTRNSPAHTHELIYPMAERTAAFLYRWLRPGSALDLGCAKGFLVEALQRSGVSKVFGIDVSRYAVSAGRAATSGKLVVGEVTRGIPVRSACCDLVTAVDIFEHLTDPDGVLQEIARVLQDDGRAYLKICHPRHPNARRDPTHVNVRPMRYWKIAFQRAGFQCTRVYESDFVLQPGLREWGKRHLRQWRERFVIGTPADYKFILTKVTCTTTTMNSKTLTVPVSGPSIHVFRRLREAQVSLLERAGKIWKTLDGTTLANLRGFYCFLWAKKR